MAYNVVSFYELTLFRVGEDIPSGPGVGEFCAASCAFRVQLVSTKQRVTGATGVETAVNVKESVS